MVPSSPSLRVQKVLDPPRRAHTSPSVEEGMESSRGASRCPSESSAGRSDRSTCSVRRKAIPAHQAMLLLKAGNERFVRGRPMAASMNHQARHAMDINKSPHTAVVGCADCPVPLETIFDALPGDIYALRNAGNTCTHAEGSMMGSIEFCCGSLGSKLIVVLGHYQCRAIAGAARTYSEVTGDEEGILLELMKSVKMAAELSEGELIDTAVKVNVFRTVDYLLQSSKTIQTKVKGKQLELVGAIFDSTTGRVEFMGKSPQEAMILSSPPKVLNTPTLGPNPAAAMQRLAEGNARFALGTTRRGGLTSAEATYAAVVSCSDCATPVESIFDAMNGELFILNTTANMCSSREGSLLGSLEFCACKLNAAVILVLGHKSCGAVASCGRMMHKRSSQEKLGGGLDGIMEDLSAVMQRAISEVGPDGPVASKTVELNVFGTMEKLLRQSGRLQERIRLGRLELQGAVFDEDTNCVDFLGHLPQLGEILMEPRRVPVSQVSAKAALRLLREGNERWVKDVAIARTSHNDDGHPPFCTVIGCADMRTPVEQIFDAMPGDIFVLKNAGNTITHAQGSVVTSLEFCTDKLKTKLILVLGHTSCRAVSSAITMGSSDSKACEALLEGIRSAADANPQDMSVEEAVEANVMHTANCLLRHSNAIREKVHNGDLEVHGAIYNCATGEVRFLSAEQEQDTLRGA